MGGSAKCAIIPSESVYEPMTTGSKSDTARASVVTCTALEPVYRARYTSACCDLRSTRSSDRSTALAHAVSYTTLALMIEYSCDLHIASSSDRSTLITDELWLCTAAVVPQHLASQSVLVFKSLTFSTVCMHMRTCNDAHGLKDSRSCIALSLSHGSGAVIAYVTAVVLPKSAERIALEA